MLSRLGRLVGYDKCYGNENLMAFGPRDSTDAAAGGPSYTITGRYGTQQER